MSVKPAPNPTVLILDDDHNFLEVLEVHFREWGYYVEATGNYEEALKLAGSPEVDILVLDMILPKKGAPEFRADLDRVYGEFKKPVVFITGGDFDQSSKNLHDLYGAQGFVFKDAPLEELKETCAKLLKRG